MHRSHFPSVTSIFSSYAAQTSFCRSSRGNAANSLCLHTASLPLSPRSLLHKLHCVLCLLTPLKRVAFAERLLEKIRESDFTPDKRICLKPHQKSHLCISLRSLQSMLLYLDLSYNNLLGTIPDVRNMHTMWSINLAENTFSGLCRY